MKMVSVRSTGSEDPLAGFDCLSDTRSKVYFLQVKTGSHRLDNALYSVAHPDAPDASPGMTHEQVVEEVRRIAEHYPAYHDIATELAGAYETEYCSA